MSTYTALFKREFQEHRTGFLLTPAIIAGLMLLAVMLTLMVFDSGTVMMDDGPMDVTISSFGDLLDELSGKDAFERRMVVVGFLGVLVSPILIALPFVIIFTLLGSLYEERRDRSFLFWKSMPVSDMQEVLAKLGAALVMAPLIVLAIAIGTQVIFLIFATIVGLLQGGPVGLLWPIPTIVGSWVSALIYYVFYALWALPIFAWLLVVSAYAPRAPFVFAAIPLAVIAIVMKVLFDSSAFGEWVGQRLVGWHVIHALETRIDSTHEAAEALVVPDLFGVLGYSVTSIDFWIGLAISAVFIYAAVYLRRHTI